MMVPLGATGMEASLSQQGCSLLLHKPIRCSELKAVLTSALAAQPGGTAAPNALEPAPGASMQGVLSDRGARILVVEDNAVNQEVVLSILKKFGAHGEVVGDGFEAVEAFSSQSYDLVLMDLRMPRMDGLEATRRIRSLESASSPPGRRIPIIALTAHTMAFDRERFIDAGMDDYLSKPITPQTLLEALVRWLPPPTASSTADHGNTNEGHSLGVPQDRRATFNREALLTHTMGDEPLAQKVLETFVIDSARRLGVLATLLEDGNTEGAARELHTMRGAAALVGGDVLNALLTTLEQSASAGMLETVQEGLPELRRCLDDFGLATAADRSNDSTA